MDWSALMRAAIGARGMAPAQFWSLSPAELMVMLGGGRQMPMGRDGLADLLRDFPDDPADEDIGT